MRLAAIILFAIASPCMAQTQTARIDGPTTVAAGELVEIRADSEVGTVAWGVVQPLKYRTYEAGKVVVFAAPQSGRVELVCFVAVATNDGKILLDSKRHVVTVQGGPTPPVPPQPNPPNPAPSEFGLREIALRTAPATGRASVANNYRSVARWASETSATIDAMNAETKRRNQASVGAGNQEWAAFSSAIGKRLADLYEAGRVTTLDQHVRAWQEIASGLEAVERDE